MFLFAVLAAALVLAVIVGGDVRRLSQIRLKHPEVLIAAIVGRAAVAILGGLHSTGAVWVARPLNVLNALLLLFFVWLNRLLPGARLFGVGQSLNLIGLVAFAGRMPVLLPAYIDPASPRLTLLASNLDPLHVLLRQQRGLWFFGDVFVIPVLGQTSVVSVGDVLMALAVGWLVVRCSQRVPAGGAAYGSSPAR